jgi:Sec-independent protein secretion pathway component TatC
MCILYEIGIIAAKMFMKEAEAAKAKDEGSTAA